MMKKDDDKMAKVLKFKPRSADKSFDGQALDAWLDREAATVMRTRILWTINIIGVGLLIGIMVWKSL